ncbi:MAG: hypothetical protein Q8O30_02075 [Candidatus Omnitrophota bacterium]|nr:hypothetical protein [Candidatus Omnitrophota bacterium]
MNFYLIGTDYKHASISEREISYKQRESIATFWKQRQEDFAILSTCNRFEIYAIAENLFEAIRVRDYFYAQFPLFAQKGYFITGKVNIFNHALHLVSGLESQIKGEIQIQQQIDSWRKHDTFPSAFKNLWDKAYIEGINIRAQAGLNNSQHNIANIVFDDLKNNFHPAANLGIIMLGTGKIAELIAAYRPENIPITFISHKHRLRAKKLMYYSQDRVIDFNDLARNLLKADVLISATSSPHFILRQKSVSQIASRRARPIYIYDLAIPRDIEPEVAYLENIVLKNLDDLSPTFETYNLKIRKKLEKAEYLIEEAVKNYARDTEVRHAAKPVSFAASQ